MIHGFYERHMTSIVVMTVSFYKNRSVKKALGFVHYEIGSK